MEGFEENNLDNDFEYGEQLTIFETSKLQVGDFMTINTISGSRYVFKILSREQEGVKVRCIAGPEELLNHEDIIMNEEIFVNGKLLFGMDLSDAPQTSRVKGIIVTKGPPDFSKGSEFLYEKESERVETSSLEVGDLVVIDVKSKSTPTYVLEVIAVDMAVFLEGDKAIRYAQPKVIIKLGKKYHEGNVVKLTSSVIQRGCYLKGMNVVSDDEELDEEDKKFILRRKIRKVTVTKNLFAKIKDVVSGVIDIPDSNEPEESKELDTTGITSGEIHIPDPIRPHISPKILSDDYRETLEHLGVNLSECLTEWDIKEAWYKFKERFNDPEKKQKLIEEFRDTFIFYPPTDIAVSILYKGVLIKLNFIISFYFKGEKISEKID